MKNNRLDFDAITLDTSIYQRFNFQFYTGVLRSLRQFKKGQIKLVVSDIILDEVKSHLILEIKDAQIKVKKGANYLKKHINSALTQPDSIINTLDELKTTEQIVDRIIEEFISSCGVVTIKSSQHLDVDELLSKYGSVSSFV